MKTQLTIIAAAVALSASFSVSANQQYDNATLNPNASAANNTANPRFNSLESQRESMDHFEIGDSAKRTSIISQEDSGNFAEASQMGQEQYSRIQQSGDFNGAFVRQKGESHESLIKQVSDGSTGNLAEVTQIGGTLNDSYVYQNGDGNTADVDQVNNSDRSDSMIEQWGNGNKATVLQENNADETWSLISQNGEGNIANVEQFDAELSASYIYQTGNAGHVADVYQTGASHASTIRQNDTAAYAQHTQTGSNNTAVTTQW